MCTTHGAAAFSDQIVHEVRAWSDEFIARNCPGALDATLVLRIGEPREHVLNILRDRGCDLAALGWSQIWLLDMPPSCVACWRRRQCRCC